MLVKTKTVSRQLDVNPSTIQRWVKHFNLPCRKNEHGHLLFSEKDIHQLRMIQKQLENGLSMDEVDPNLQEEQDRVESLSMTQYEKRIDAMVERIHQVERKLSEKADEVVSVRLYQHRNEIDELTKTIGNVESRLQAIEKQLASISLMDKASKTEEVEEKTKRNWLVSLFGA
ncbi:MAG TPA: MerR family transcriptional regulator [Bacillales bacterium]|nr:MerR family transcriptional regulator [Bacillales bacterium]